MSRLYKRIASAVAARANCAATDNQEWFARHTQTIESLVREHMPSGSGFDSGTQFIFPESKPNRLVFFTEFHHMNDGGYYDGWTKHNVIVTPDLVCGFDLHVTGRDRNNIKDYIGDAFQEALSRDIEPGRTLVDDIADALGTAERGASLVAVAAASHAAEQKLAALERQEGKAWRREDGFIDGLLP